MRVWWNLPRYVVLAVALQGAGPEGLGAQGADPAPAYGPLLLDGSRYRQSIESNIVLVSGRLTSRETAGRVGFFSLVARADSDAIRLVATVDSLEAWRQGSGVRTEPSTDAVVGASFEGRLSALGAYQPIDSPFVPDELAAVTELTGAIADLLPPLPPQALTVGARWTEDGSWRITRLRDGRFSGRRIFRYRIDGTRESSDSKMLPDSTVVEARRVEEESGTMEWDPNLGLRRWNREIVVEVTIPATGGIPRGMRTRIIQRVAVERIPEP